MAAKKTRTKTATAAATKKSATAKGATKKTAAKNGTATTFAVREDESPWTAKELKEVRAELDARSPA